MAKSTSKITVQNTEITFLNKEIGEYISLTDIAKYRNSLEPFSIIGSAEKVIMCNKSINFMLFFTLQMQGNITKVLKTIALENLNNSVHSDFLFKNRIVSFNFI